MEILRLPKHRRCYLPLLFFFVILLLMMPKVRKFIYDYKKGSPWMYENLVAEFDFPLLKTEAQYNKERENSVQNVPMCYKLDDNVYTRVTKTLKTCSLGDKENLRPLLEQSLSDIYQRGVIQQTDEFSSSSTILYLQVGKTITKKPCSDVFTPSEAQSGLRSTISEQYPYVNVDSLLVSSSLQDVLIPNLIFDAKLTKQFLLEAQYDVSISSGIVSSGTLLVSKGEVITSEKEQILNSYKAEYQSKFGYQDKEIYLWLSDAVFALLLLAMVFLSIAYFAREIFADIVHNFNQYLYILVIFTLSCAATCIFERLNSELLFLMPYCLTVMYLQAFFRRKIVLPVYALSLLPLLVFAHNGIELFVMNLFAGYVCLFTFGYFHKGWLQFVNALCIFFAQLIVFLGVELMQGGLGFISYYSLSLVLLGSLLLVAAYPFIFLFEKIFGLVSTTRLNELADTNNKLLRKLANKAPGTFQHSLQVMNLVDSIGNKVGLNVDLLRVGALYHDIGKMENPACFVENETPGTPHYHKELSPKESAKDIIKHVEDGLELADENKLPDVVKDFIASHHGTSLVAYFYTQYVNAGGAEADKEDFQYSGKLPVTKEQALLMICDSVEAAARSLKDYEESTISDLVDKIISSKVASGQLDQSSISIKELIQIREELKNSVMSIYHDRVEYPKLRKQRNKGKN